MLVMEITLDATAMTSVKPSLLPSESAMSSTPWSLVTIVSPDGRMART